MTTTPVVQEQAAAVTMEVGSCSNCGAQNTAIIRFFEDVKAQAAQDRAHAA